MKRHFPGICGSAWFCLIVFSLSFKAHSQEGSVDFHKTIKPLFDKYCVSCHGAETTEAFRIDLKEDAMDYITPGNSEDSQLYQVLVTEDESELMPPPDEENPLSEKQIELIKLWIEQGAQWPASETDSIEKPAIAKIAGASESNPLSAQSTLPPPQDNPPQPQSTASADPAAMVPAQTDPPLELPAGQSTAGQADQRIYRAIGSLHPATVHLPTGLLMAAGFFALLSLRGNFVMSDCAYYCLWLGALGCVVASLTGWWAAPMKFRTEGIQEFGDLFKSEHRVFWHRTGGLVLTVVSLVLAMFAASARNRDPDDGMLWKLGLILLAIAVGWVGYEGGKLTYGKYRYKDLNELSREWFPSVFGPKEAEPNIPRPNLESSPPSENDDPPAEDSSEDSLEDIGRASGET
jgi:uncharacterized membrane protein